MLAGSLLHTSAAATTASVCDAALQYVLSIAAEVEKILLGSAAIDPMQYGMTTDEEKAASEAGNVSSLREG